MTFVRHFLTIPPSMGINKRRTVKITFIRKVISLLWRKVCEVFAKNKYKVHNHYQMICYRHLEVYVALLYKYFLVFNVVKHLQRIVYTSKQQAACQSCLIRLDLKHAEKMKVKLYGGFCTKMLYHYAHINLLFHRAFCLIGYLASHQILTLLRCILLSCKNTALFCIASWCKA